MTQYRVPELSTFNWQKNVKNQLTTPPGSPAKGDRYIVKATATGAWTGHENAIVWCNDATGPVWSFDVPTEGWQVWDESANRYYLFDGSSWCFDLIISSNVTLYVATTGSDLNGTGTISAPWATLAKALAYLQDFRLAAGVTVTIQLGEGLFTTSVEPTHLQGSQIKIVGANTYTKTVTSLQSVSGNATTGYYPVINVSDVANVAVGDHILIPYTLSKGTPDTIKSWALVGCFKITYVDVPNKRLTLYSHYQYPSFPTSTGQAFDAGTNSATILKTILYHATLPIITLRNQHVIANLDKVAIEGGDNVNNTSNMGIYLDTFGCLTCGISVGVGYCYVGARLINSSVLNAGYLRLCNNQSNNLMLNQSTFAGTYAVFSGSATGSGIQNVSGLVSSWGAFSCGNRWTGVDAEAAGTCVVPSATVCNNWDALVAYTGSVVTAQNGTACYNQNTGCYGAYGSLVYFNTGNAQYNAGGAAAWDGTFIYTAGGTIANNTSYNFSPVVNTAGNSNSFIHG